MISPSSDPNKTTNEPLPTASKPAMGCLAVSGCGGSLLLMLLVILVFVQGMFLINGWVSGKPPGMVRFDHGLAPWAFCILSAFAFQSIKTRIQKPWVYWLAAACLAAWCYYACTSELIKIDYPGASEANQRRLGSWIMTVLTNLVFLCFIFSRKNREYYRVVQPKKAAL